MFCIGQMMMAFTVRALLSLDFICCVSAWPQISYGAFLHVVPRAGNIHVHMNTDSSQDR